MSTAKRLTHIDRESEGYFEDLASGTRELVRELMSEAADDRHGPEGYKTNEEAFSDVECHSRDGFIPFSHNRGGLIYRNFCDLMDYFGGGYSLAHGKANVALGGMLDSAEEDCRTETYEKHQEFCDAMGIAAKDLSYGFIEERANGRDGLSTKLTDEQREQFGKMRRTFEDAEDRNYRGENASVMHELRVMYHGKEDSLHSASVSAAVNLEAPYHRSSIAWAPNVFCEGAKEVEITWRNQAELKRKLARALKQVSKAVF